MADGGDTADAADTAGAMARGHVGHAWSGADGGCPRGRHRGRGNVPRTVA